MASVTMAAASFLTGATLTHRPYPATTHRRLVITNSSSAAGGGNKVAAAVEKKREEESDGGRRRVMFAAAAAAVCSVASVAMADPKRGTPEARKAYAPVCVTMPTAKICHK